MDSFPYALSKRPKEDTSLSDIMAMLTDIDTKVSNCDAKINSTSTGDTSSQDSMIDSTSEWRVTLR